MHSEVLSRSEKLKEHSDFRTDNTQLDDEVLRAATFTGRIFGRNRVEVGFQTMSNKV